MSIAIYPMGTRGRFCCHMCRYIEKVAENIGGSSESQDESQPYTTNNASATKYNVADLFEIVNVWDKGTALLSHTNT